MDDLEKAILFTFDQTGGVSQSLKAQATSFLDQLRSNALFWKLCVDRFSSTRFSEVRFWCLQSLLSIARGPEYEAIPQESRAALRSSVLTWVCETCAAPDAAFDSFIKNKVAQLAVALVQRDYPRDWPEFFPALIAACSRGGPPAVDMFNRVMQSLDEDVVSLEVPRTPDESKKSMLVKDALRDHAMQQIAATWHALASTYCQTYPSIAAATLETMSRYVSWMDISYVVNDSVPPLLFGLVSGGATPQLQAAAAVCLTQVVSKRMDPSAKIRVLQRLGVVPFVAAWADSPYPLEQPPPGAASGGAAAASELVHRCAELVATLAVELLDCWKRAENGVVSLQAVGLEVRADAIDEAKALVTSSVELLNLVIPAAVRALGAEAEGAQTRAASALADYVARLRRLPPGQILPEQRAHLGLMLARLAVRAQLPGGGGDGSDAGSDSQSDAEEEEGGGGGGLGGMGDGDAGDAGGGAAADDSDDGPRRNELFTLYKNIAKLAPADTLAFTSSLLASTLTAPGGGLTSPAGAPPPGPTWRQVEVSVSLVYQLGENLMDEGLRGATWAALEEAVLALVQYPIPHARRPPVALAVLETFVRYAKVFAARTDRLPTVLGAFLDDRGIGHPDKVVSSRACYLFMRLVKALKAPLTPLVPQVLAALETHLGRIAASPLDPPRLHGPMGGRAQLPANASNVDDRLYAFEAVGHLLAGTPPSAAPPAGPVGAMGSPPAAPGPGEPFVRSASPSPSPSATPPPPGGPSLPPEDQARYLEALLRPLVAQVRSNLAALAAQTPPPAPPAAQHHERQILQALVAVQHVSKGFPAAVTAARPAIATLLLTAVEAAVEVVRVQPSNRTLRARVIPFTHRMVECLGTAVLPGTTPLLLVLLNPAAECPEICEALVLMNQLASRFKEAMSDLLVEAFPACVARVHGRLSDDWDWTGRRYLPPGASGRFAQAAIADVTNGGSSESVRERNELQRCYYAFLLSAVQNGLQGALARAQGGALDSALSALLQGASAHVDQTVRKTCLQALERLVEAWLAPGAAGTEVGAEAFAGFRQFAMERVGWECCVRGLVRGGLDPRDAATTGLVMEAAAALRLLYDRCGREAFAAALAQRCAAELGCGPEACGQLGAALAGGEARALRQALKGLFPAAPAGGAAAGRK